MPTSSPHLLGSDEACGQPNQARCSAGSLNVGDNSGCDTSKAQTSNPNPIVRVLPTSFQPGSASATPNSVTLNKFKEMLARATSSTPEFEVSNNVPVKQLLKKKDKEHVDPLKYQGIGILKLSSKGIKLGNKRRRDKLRMTFRCLHRWLLWIGLLRN